ADATCEMLHRGLPEVDRVRDSRCHDGVDRGMGLACDGHLDDRCRGGIRDDDRSGGTGTAPVVRRLRPPAERRVGADRELIDRVDGAAFRGRSAKGRYIDGGGGGPMRLGLAMALTIIAAMQSAGAAQQATPEARTVTGEWTFTAEGYVMPLSLRQDGTSLTGTLAGFHGPFPLPATIHNNP